MTKALKIVGIVFLVAAILFGGTYLTINILNKKTERYEVFADSVFWDKDMTAGKGIASSEAVAFRMNDDSSYIQYSLVYQYNYLKPYFSTVGINYFQEKSLKNKIKNVTEKSKILGDYINEYENDNAHFVPFYSAVMPTYIETASAQLDLIKEMQNILIENGVKLNETAMFYFNLNNVLCDIAINVDYKSALYGYQNNQFHFRGNFTSVSFIQTINQRYSLFFENPTANTLDVDKLINDYSYKAYTSSLIRYRDALSQLNSDDLLAHTKKSTISSETANYEKIKAANESYNQLYDSLWLSEFDLKLCPFSSETANDQLNLLRYVIDNGSTEVSV